MKDILEYNDFLGSVHFSSDDDIFYGQIIGINDLVTFEGKTVKELRTAFISSVKDYLELCKEIGKDPFKSFKGSFNVRVDPKLHMLSFKTAKKCGIPLNKFVQQALEHEVVLQG